MTLVKRAVKGSALTHGEMDANWDHVLSRANHAGTQAIGTVDGLAGALENLQPAGNYASSDQGALADTALQPSAAVSDDADNALSHGSDGRPYLDVADLGGGG